MRLQFIVITLVLLFISQPFYAQLVGGRENEQTTPQEVKTSAITEGGFSGDVSLFTGT